nr:reverse transcriptase domain-containing protein [Tanacetum cinerariifolium]
MTLELADRSITHPKGVAEDVFVKVEKFHFSTDFVVVDFEADPRVPLILGRSFVRTGRALIDVYGEEITLRVNDESITFNLSRTMRYSSTYDDMSVNRIDVIDVAREEYAQKTLGFSNNSLGVNPTSTSKPIISDFSPSLTPFEGSDFILEEIEAYLKDELILPEINHADYDPEEDICLIEKLLNDDPFQLPSMDLKQREVVKKKSSIEEPPELELKDLPSHLEYAYLEGANKLPVIIAKDLKDDKKEALLKVLKSHKRAIAWKITDIKGIDPHFCTLKILMEEDYKPAVQSQRRVNQKIHEVIKKEIIKLLDAGMIYPIYDSSWVSPIHCVPKNGGITVVKNENNELIPTRLVTDQEKTTFTCLYGTFAYRTMPFGLCNALGTFQRCMMAIFHDMIEKPMEVFMDDFSVFRDSFSSCLSHLDTMLQWLEVDRDKVDFIAKLPHPTTVKCVRSFLGHAGFYRRFIRDFSKIARPNTHLLEKEKPFVFSKDCIDAFETLKKKLTEALILVVPDWNLPFELMCDASDFTIVWTYRLATAYHPQISGQVEVSNHGLKCILERTVGKNRASWFQKLEDALWAFRTAYKTPIGCTPYKLVYGKSCHLPIELEHKAYWALKHVNFDLKTEDDHRKLQLNELNEIRDQAYENSLIYKEKMKKLHDSKIKNRIFNVGDRVLLFNSRLKILSGKLKTHWSGPFTITKVFPYGSVELSQPDGLNFKVNGHRVKHYFGGDIP